MKKPLKVLIAEDSEDDAKLALRALRRGGFDPTYRRVQTAAELETALAEERWDAVISDFNMPGFTGMDALMIFRSTGLDVPFILVSGTIGEETAVDAMKAGASDYLMKKSLARLAPALERELKETQIRAAHRRAQGALTDSEERFRQMAENIHDVFFLIDADSNRVLYISPAYEKIWGRTRESVYASTEAWAETIHPDDRASTYEKFKKGMLAGKLAYEYRIVRPDGSIRWMETRGFPVRDDAGRMVRIAGVSEDITERKQAGQELRESERRFGDMLQNVELVSLMLDREARITYCNEYLLRLTGWRHEEVIGRNWFELFIPPETDDVKDNFAALLANQPEALHYENEILTRSGERRLIRWNNSVLRSGAGDVIGTASIGEDITEQKRAEIRIKRLNRVYAVLSGINTLIVRVHERRELFNEACRIAVEQGNFAMAWIGLLDPATQDVTPVAWAGKAAEALARVKSSAREGTLQGRGAVGMAIRERRPVFNNDMIGQGFGGPRHVEIMKLGFQSQITLPLYEDQAVVGTLTMYVREPGFFDEEEIRLLSELAGDISFALENISRQRKLDKLSRIRAVSSEINAAIIRVHDRDELFREACRIAVQSGRFPLAWVALADRRGKRVKAVAWAGDERGFVQLTRPTVDAKDQGKAGLGAQAIANRRPAICNDIEAEGSAMRYPKEALERGYRSAVALPLVVDGTAVAALVLYAAEPGFFDDEEMKLLVDLAGNVSFALEHMARQEKIGKLSRIRAVSSEINATIIRIHDREALLRETCRIAVEHGKFELVWIGTVDTAKQQIQAVAWNGFSEAVAQRVTWNSASTAGGTLGEAIRTAKPTVRNDIETEISAGGMRAEALKQGCLSTVCMPLVVDNNVVVLISLFAPGKGFFDEDELTLLNEVAADVSFALQAIEKREKLEYLSYYDVLTGLANRTLFLERVAQHMRSAAGGGHKLALYLIDLERFKNINDSLGRAAGDALLKQVAEWLTRTAGDANLCARVGADHFAVVLPEVKQDGDVARLLEKSLAAFLDHPFRLNDAVFRIALKVGVALFPDDGANADILFTNAEAALKKAKSSGERYLFHTRKMTESVAGRLTLENQLRQALEKEEYVLHYQPKMDLASGKVTSAEALIRWNDPATGLVPPGQFIPLLEETGLIHEVGRWALRKAVSDYLRWRAAGLAAVRIAVNVSPLQLRNRGFVAEVEEAIGIDAHAAAGLELEITESLIMEDVKHSISTLQAIRALGVSIAIDDFGTGFSSLSYLAKLPLDTLKIDRSFVTDMTAGPDGLALVSTIINLAHSLKLTVVAEGVETEEQSRLLRLLGCDEMQGYLFSKPVPAEVFETRFLAAPAVVAAPPVVTAPSHTADVV